MALLHIVRHPQCVLNALGRYQGRETNSPFTSLGNRQADALARRLVEVRLDRILIPPLTLRHRQLVDRINAVRPVPAPIVEDPLLAEVDYGEWECLTKPECALRDIELWDAFHVTSPIDGDFTIPGGSSFREMREQVRAFLNGELFLMDANVELNELAISSFLTIRVMVAMITGQNPGHVRQCTLTTFERVGDAFQVVRLFEDDYLPEAGV